MKKLFVALTAFAFVMAIGLPAMANETNNLNEEDGMVVPGAITITKAVYIGVKQIVKPSSSAEAHAVKKDTNQGNRVTETPSEGTNATPPTYEVNPITGEYYQVPGTGTIGADAVIVEKTATIDGESLDGAAGIINVNQSPGSINNQGNAVAVAYSAKAATLEKIDYNTEGEARFIGGAFLHAEASADKINGGLGNSTMTLVDHDNDPSTPDVAVIGAPLGNKVMATATERTNVIDDALGDVTGIVGVNQSAGNINNQNNAVSLSVGDGIAAISDASLDLLNAGNYAAETATVTSDTLTTGALASASGIIGINQSSGNMNNQANVVAACVIVHPHLSATP